MKQSNVPAYSTIEEDAPRNLSHISHGIDREVFHNSHSDARCLYTKHAGCIQFGRKSKWIARGNCASNKLWVFNELTLGRTNGSQTRGTNKNNSANALPNVHAPIWLVVFVIPVWVQCPHLTITGLFPKSDLRIPRSQRVTSMAVAITTGIFSSSAGGDDMVIGVGLLRWVKELLSQKNDE